MAIPNSGTKKILVSLIRGYQYLLSPLMGQTCRFYPSCSQYAIEAIQLHGTLKGIGYTFKRLLCCHPWHKGGFDPVSKKREK